MCRDRKQWQRVGTGRSCPRMSVEAGRKGKEGEVVRCCRRRMGDMSMVEAQSRNMDKVHALEEAEDELERRR